MTVVPVRPDWSEVAQFVYEHPDYGPIRAFVIDGEVWFLSGDVARNLRFADTSSFVAYVPEDERRAVRLYRPNGSQSVVLVSVDAVYRACYRRKFSHVRDGAQRNLAMRFAAWATHELMATVQRLRVMGIGFMTEEEQR